MNSFHEFETYLLTHLADLYGLSEVRWIIRALWEDLWCQDETLMVSDLEIIVTRLQQFEPVAYITGWSHFYGMKLAIKPGVLIPRPETEELVEWILLDQIKYNSLRVIDIGTGTGCIALVLKKNRPQWQVIGLDMEKTAIDLATENANLHNLDIHWIKADIFKKTLQGTFDIIVSNPPYITYSEQSVMSPSTLTYEPESALFVDDYLKFYVRIESLAIASLRRHGRIYFELNEYRAKNVEEYFIKSQRWKVDLKQDLSGKYRMLRLILK